MAREYILFIVKNHMSQPNTLENAKMNEWKNGKANHDKIHEIILELKVY